MPKSTVFHVGKVGLDAAEYASQGSAVLGIRGSGKTYTATLIAEQLFDAGIPFVAFDPIGVWRFLRVPGAGKGYPVVVAGGQAGDLPLSPVSAPKIVEAAMHAGVSLVIDLFDMNLSKADWRRIVRDCVRLLLHRNSQHGLRHIFLEEAAEFAPQRVTDGEVYAEIEKLARMGGNSRLGYTLINQRSEEVNKAVLELCDTLFLHRQKGRNSLTALSKWLDIGNVQDPKRMIETLATLPTGECWVWPGGSEKAVRVKVQEKNSLHPDRTVMRGQGGAKAKAAVNVETFLAGLKEALPQIEREAEENDPKRLKRRIAELERAKGPVIDPGAIKAAEERGWEKGRRDALVAVRRLKTDVDTIGRGVASQADAVEKLKVRIEQTLEPVAGAGPVGFVDTKPVAIDEARKMPPRVRASDVFGADPAHANDALPEGEKAVLVALAQYPDGLRKDQLGILTGYKRSTRDAYIQRMQPKGFVERRGDRVLITPAGIAALGDDYEPPLRGAALRDRVLRDLPEGEAQILRVLIDHYPALWSRGALDEEIGFARSTRDAYLQRLKARELIVRDGAMVRASDNLFMD